jgi:hypothetical protein
MELAYIAVSVAVAIASATWVAVTSPAGDMPPIVSGLFAVIVGLICGALWALLLLAIPFALIAHKYGQCRL